eukprot:jgi/Galph1/5683/GphlegSOOS_G4392.1
MTGNQDSAVSKLPIIGDISGDGGVIKRIQTPGTGPLISSGSTVTVNYVGKLDNGEVFDSTKERQEPFTFTVGQGQVIKGWDIALCTMKVGEVATIRCSPSYAYGKKGVPPVIPSSAYLTFEIQVLEMQTNNKSKTNSIKSKDNFEENQPKQKNKKNIFDQIYFISPFASQSGEKPPWWLNPIVTFSIIFFLVGIAFYIVVQSGALHYGSPMLP